MINEQFSFKISIFQFDFFSRLMKNDTIND